MSPSVLEVARCLYTVVLHGEEGERVREVEGEVGGRERETGTLYYSATSIIRTSFIWHLDYPVSLKPKQCTLSLKHKTVQ